MTSSALPPLIIAEPRPSLKDNLFRWGIVLAAHLAVIYGVLYLSVKNDLVQLPSSITARLLPMMEERKVEPLPPSPPPKTPQVTRQKPQPQPVLAAKAEDSAPTAFTVAPQPPAPPAPVTAPPAPVAVTAARFDADYLHNPKPVYPPFSRRNGEEGKVILRVKVSPKGEALEVDVKQSSNFPRLDAAAREAVARWRFVPAKRGDEAVESWVLVPITFSLD